MGTREQNLTGVWNGLYTYSSGLSVSFVATLIESGSGLFGSTHEPDVLGWGGTLTANLTGSQHGSAIAFVKVYDDAGEWYQPVNYEGALNGDASEIEGRWRIADGSAGKFLMIRSPGKEVAVERKRTVRV